MDLNQLLGAVSRLVNERTGPVQEVDTGGFLGEVAGMFRQHADATGQQINEQDILPASMDPYGDPADRGQYAGQYGDQYQGQQVLPASMDPLGDPADQEQGVLPASMDPRGDPADEPQPRFARR